MTNLQGRWMLWGLAALCGGVVVWRLWPQDDVVEAPPSTRALLPQQEGVNPERARPVMKPRLEPKPAQPRPGVAMPVGGANQAEAVESKPPRNEAALSQPSPPQSKPEKASSGRVHLNRATLSELTTLPGIGPALAKRIMAARPFEAVEDLLEVPGIGPVVVDGLKDEQLVEV